MNIHTIGNRRKGKEGSEEVNSTTDKKQGHLLLI